MRTPLTIIAALGVIITPWLNAQDSDPVQVRVACDNVQDPDCEDPKIIGNVAFTPAEELRANLQESWLTAVAANVQDPAADPSTFRTRYELEMDPQEGERRLRVRLTDMQNQLQQESDKRAKLDAIIAQQRAQAKDAATLSHLAAMELLVKENPDAMHDAWVAQQDALEQLRGAERGDVVAAERQLQMLKLQEERTRLMDESNLLRARAMQLRELADARAQIEIAGRVVDQDGRRIAGARLDRLRQLEADAVDPRRIAFDRTVDPACEGVLLDVTVAECPAPTCPAPSTPGAQCPTPTCPSPSNSSTCQPNSQGGGVTVIVENGDVHIYNGPNGPSVRATGGVSISSSPSCDPKGSVGTLLPTIIYGMDREAEVREAEVRGAIIDSAMESYLRAVEEEPVVVDVTDSLSGAFQVEDLSSGQYILYANEVGDYERALAEITANATSEACADALLSAETIHYELPSGELHAYDLNASEYVDLLAADINLHVANAATLEAMDLEVPAPTDLRLPAGAEVDLLLADVTNEQQQADMVMQEMHALMAEMHAELEALRRELAEISDDVRRSPMK